MTTEPGVAVAVELGHRPGDRDRSSTSCSPGGVASEVVAIGVRASSPSAFERGVARRPSLLVAGCTIDG
jgi:hypothetical protein